MYDLNRFTIASVDDILAFNNAKELEFKLEDVTNFAMEGTEDALDITGKLGSLLMTIKRNKALTITATNGLVCGGLLAAQFGSDIESGTYNTVVEYEGVVNSGNLTFTGAVSGTTGNEIGVVYVMTGANRGKKLTQGSSTSTSGVFTFEEGASENEHILTFNSTDVPNGTKVRFYYEKPTTGSLMADSATKYAKTVRLIINLTLKDPCNGEFHGQIIAERAETSGEFNFSFGDNAVTQDFSSRIMADKCVGDDEYIKIIVFEDEE